jgi:hypothetical protein
MNVVEPQVAVKPGGQPGAGTAGVLSPAPPDTDVVISVRNVGKMYRLYDQPQDRLMERMKGVLQGFSRSHDAWNPML